MDLRLMSCDFCQKFYEYVWWSGGGGGNLDIMVSFTFSLTQRHISMTMKSTKKMIVLHILPFPPEKKGRDVSAQ